MLVCLVVWWYWVGVHVHYLSSLWISWLDHLHAKLMSYCFGEWLQNSCTSTASWPISMVIFQASLKLSLYWLFVENDQKTAIYMHCRLHSLNVWHNQHHERIDSPHQERINTLDGKTDNFVRSCNLILYVQNLGLEIWYCMYIGEKALTPTFSSNAGLGFFQL